MMQPRRPRSTRDARAGLDFALSVVARPNLPVVAWRWRYELGLAAALTAAATVLILAEGLGWMLAVTAAAAALCWLPAARRPLIRRAWCIITPHRIRTGCAQAWIHSRDGKIPIVVLTTSEPFGERVRIWCRAGTCPQDFVAARAQLAAACWAMDVGVATHARFAQIVLLDVIRYPQRQLPGGPAADRWPGAAQLPPAPWPQRRDSDDLEPGSDTQRETSVPPGTGAAA
jgi:hypothetical protein